MDAPAAYGPYTTLYNRCRGWSEQGIFQLLLAELTPSDGMEPEAAVLMIDAASVKAHGTAPILSKGLLPRA